VNSGLTRETLLRVWSGDEEDVARLISDDPDVVRRRGEQGLTLLHHVAMPETDHFQFPNQERIAELLLKAGAVVDARTTRSCETPLHWAASADNPGVAEILLATGANLEAADAQGQTPLAVAAFFGAPNTIGILLRRGALVADVSIAAGVGDMALFEAKIRDLFGTDTVPNLTAADGKTQRIMDAALSMAAMHGRQPIAEYLLDLGVDPNSNPLDGHSARTALHWAVYRNQPELVKLLIARGADLGAVDVTHQATPLAWAKHHGREQIQAIIEAAGGR